MKTILLTSTALVMSVGMAVAEVAVTGDGRMGVQSLNGGDVAFSSRIRIVFTASGESDNGLTFGGSIRADNAGKGVDAKHCGDAASSCTVAADGSNVGDNTSSGGGVSGTAGSVFIMGPFGTVTMGDTAGAAKTAVGQAGGVGYTGLGDLNEITYIADVGLPTARWDYTMGDLSLHASADNPGPPGDQALSGGMAYSIGDVGFGVGVERLGDNQNVVAGVSAALGDASVKIVFGSNDDNNAATEDEQFGASASFVSGSATFTAFTSRKNDQDHFGIGASFDLGGSAKVVGGFVDGDSLADSSFDLGVTLGF